MSGRVSRAVSLVQELSVDMVYVSHQRGTLEWKTQQDSFTGTGTISGHGVGKSSERNSVSGRLSMAVSLVQELLVDMV